MSTAPAVTKNMYDMIMHLKSHRSQQTNAQFKHAGIQQGIKNVSCSEFLNELNTLVRKVTLQDGEKV